MCEATINILWLYAAGAFGGLCGVIVSALCVAAKRGDRP